MPFVSAGLRSMFCEYSIADGAATNPPYTHVNSIGANRPNWRELDDEALAISKIYVESRESAAVESGDLIAGGNIFAEIGEVVSDRKPGRESHHEITLFKSLGTAVEDIAAADIVYQKATRPDPGQDSAVTPTTRQL